MRMREQRAAALSALKDGFKGRGLQRRRASSGGVVDHGGAMVLMDRSVCNRACCPPSQP
jgi:hypothetical protein